MTSRMGVRGGDSSSTSSHSSLTSLASTSDDVVSESGRSSRSSPRSPWVEPHGEERRTSASEKANALARKFASALLARTRSGHPSSSSAFPTPPFTPEMKHKLDRLATRETSRLQSGEARYHQRLAHSLATIPSLDSKDAVDSGEGDVSKLMSMIEDLQDQNAERERDLREAADFGMQLYSLLEHARQQIDTKDDEMMKMVEIFQQYQASQEELVLDLRSQINLQRTESSDVENERVKLLAESERAHHLRSQLEQARSMMDQCQGQIKSLQNEINQRDQKISQLMRKLDDKEAKLNEMIQEKRSSSDESTRRLLDQIEDLQNSLTRRDRQLSYFQNHARSQDQELARLRELLLAEETQFAARMATHTNNYNVDSTPSVPRSFTLGDDSPLSSIYSPSLSDITNSSIAVDKDPLSAVEENEQQKALLLSSTLEEVRILEERLLVTESRLHHIEHSASRGGTPRTLWDASASKRHRTPMEEYFALLCLSLRLHNETKASVWKLDSRRMYEEVVSQRRPFHQWYVWIEERFRQME